MIGNERAKYLEEHNYAHCDEVAKYKIINKIGFGGYGEMFKAKDKANPEKIVAIKKMSHSCREGFSVASIREIKLLKAIEHTNVIRLIEVYKTKATANNLFMSTTYLIFEFCEHDLAGLLSTVSVKFNLGEVKEVMQQLLKGLRFIHSSRIVHRDLKAANVLINKEGQVKLANFGQSRPLNADSNKPNRYTNPIVTLWFRAPELLLGDKNCGPAIDLWGAGCIMAQMWKRFPILQGHTEQHQLLLISQLCGSITPEIWPSVRKLELFNNLELIQGQRRKVKEELKPYVKNDYACDLIDKLLILDPARRCNANDALKHDFFWTNPMPCDLSQMLAQYNKNMFQYATLSKSQNHSQHESPRVNASGQTTNETNSQYQDRAIASIGYNQDTTESFQA